MLEFSISAKKNYNNIVMLSYYRNNLVHVFLNDSEISCTLLGMASIYDVEKGVPIDEVREKFWSL